MLGEVGGMPTLLGLAGGCAMADACDAETGSTTWSALAVRYIAAESEAATGEFEAPVSALELLVYVPACECVVMSNQKKQTKTIKEHRADQSKQAKTY